MRQALHIFKKDVHLLFPEILVALAVAAAFMTTVAAGAGYGGESPSAHPLAFQLLSYLFPLTWYVLIARVIFNDPAAGDRRFWVTRPQPSHTLILAKLLFVVAFVNVPKLISDAVIIHAYGFRITSELGGLMWAQILLTVMVVLPIMAVCALTAGLAQLLSVTFLLGLLVVGWVRLAYVLSGDTGWIGFEWIRLYASGLVIAAGATAVILLQYARRRVAPIRLIAAGTLVMAALVGAWFPWKLGFALQSRLSAQRVDTSALRVELDRERAWAVRSGIESGLGVEVEIPIRVRGLPEGVTAQPEAITAVIEEPHGPVWIAGHDPRSQVRSRGEVTSVFLRVDRAFYSKVRTSPVRIRGALYLTLYGDERSELIPLERKPALRVTPGLGLCIVTHSIQGCLLSCATAFRSKPDLVSADVVGRRLGLPMSFRTLSVSSSGPVSYSPFPAEIDLVPVTLTNKYTEVSGPVKEVRVRAVRPVAYVSPQFELADLRLADYEKPGR